MTQVNKGWLECPRPLGELGNLVGDPPGSTVVAFRFGVDQGGEIRACDDLKYSTANQYCAFHTPIKLPTWDHIGQMALEVKDTPLTVALH